MAGYLLVAVLVAMSGFLGLYGTEKIVILLSGKDQRLRSIVVSAFKLTLDAKDAETDITMYLLLGHEMSKESYFQHLADLRNAVASLDETVQVPQGKKILALIKSDTERVAPAGQALLDSFEKDMKTNGSYVPSHHSALAETFFALTSNIRGQGLKLAELETDFLNKQEPITASLELASYAKRLQGHLFAYLLLQNKEDKQKVFDRYQSAKRMTSILDEKLNDPAARKILDDIKTEIEQIMPTVQKLLEVNADNTTEKVHNTRENQDVLIHKVCALTDGVSNNALALARFNVALEIEPKRLALESARLVQFIIFVITVIPVILAFILGHAANRKANELEESRSKLADLNNELDQRSNELAITNEHLKDEILEHEKAEEEKTNLIIELQKALSEVKILSGFIPICASCKKIRDDKGFWNQVETYISDHSEAIFSHSICPDCMRSLYPEIADDVLGRLEKDEKK